MKKIAAAVICLAVCAALAACGGRKTEGLKISMEKSGLYSEDDIYSAIQTIVDEFNRDWNGCTLTEISYAGDERTAAEAETRAEDYPGCEVIVLTSSFDVDSSGGDGSLEANTTYEDWSWILVREKGGKWRHVDHGYG